MDWSHDFCLWCDTQTLAGSLYCSQACRLADLEKPGSTPTSPGFSFFHDAVPAGQASRSGAQRSSGQFHLPPPFDFAAYRAPASSRTPESPPTSPRTAGPPPSSHAPTAAATASTTAGPTAALHLPPPRFLPQTLLSMSGRRTSEHLITRNTANRTLNASSSRSSLSSVSSASSNNSGISDQALSQLQGYANSFDHVRDWKRRVTLG